MKLWDLVKGIEAEVTGFSEQEVKGVAEDSRKVVPGGIFAAVKGHTVDGHDFIEDAIGRGAVAIVHEDPVTLPEGVASIRVPDTEKAIAKISYEFYGRPDESMTMIGITGTNGKTSSTYFIGSILEAMGKKVGIMGTNGAVIGNEHLTLQNTTPHPVVLHEMLAKMVQAGCTYCVMETSSHALDLGRVEHLHFDYALFTNLTQDHLDFHQDMEHYYQAKLKLFFKAKKMAIINGDDPYGRRLLEDMPKDLPRLIYGIDADDAAIQASQLVYHLNGVSYHLTLPQGEVDLHTKTPGRFTVYNTMMAAGLAAELGAPLEVIRETLDAHPGVKGRFQVVHTETDYHVIIDYAHTPDSLEKILQAVNEFKTGRLVVIFGAGGDRDHAKRPLMGAAAGKYADFSIITSDNPRSEDPEAIITDILEGITPHTDQFVTITDRKEAIYYAIDHAQKDDMIVLAGKGHETYVLRHGIKYPFDEEAIVMEYIQAKKKEQA